MSFKGMGRKNTQSGWAGIAATLMALIVMAAPAWSQTAATEAAKLEQLRQHAASLEQQQSQLENKLKGLQESLREVQSKPSPEQTELAQALEVLEQARAAQAEAPSEVNASRVQNAEFKFALSERKFAKSNSEAAALQESIEELQTQVDAARKDADRTRNLIASQQAAVTRLQQQRLTAARQAREQQQQQLELQRTEAAAAQQEIRRLRAMLEAQEAEAQRQVQSAPAEAVAEQVVPAEMATRTQTVADTDSILLTDRIAVMGALTAMQQRLGEIDPRRAPVNRILHVKRDMDSEAHTLRALSADQYRAEATLAAGASELVVGFHRWQIDVPTAGDYVFLYNAIDSKKPQLLMYRAQLEN